MARVAAISKVRLPDLLAITTAKAATARMRPHPIGLYLIHGDRSFLKRIGLVVVLFEIVDPGVGFKRHELKPWERTFGDVTQGLAFPVSGLLDLGAGFPWFLVERESPIPFETDFYVLRRSENLRTVCSRGHWLWNDCWPKGRTRLASALWQRLRYGLLDRSIDRQGRHGGCQERQGCGTVPLQENCRCQRKTA